MQEAARIVVAIREEGKDKEVHIEMGWVGDKTGGKHEVIIYITLHCYDGVSYFNLCLSVNPSSDGTGSRAMGED